MSNSNCKDRELIFVIRDTNPRAAVIEDDIRADLAEIGMNVTVRALNSSEYTQAERLGEYNMLLSQTWGAPYDPHTYLNSWEVPSHVEYSAAQNVEPPLTRDGLLNSIADVQSELDISARELKWRSILNDIHQQAIFAPLYGSRVPFAIRRRLSGFTAPGTAYGYPLDGVRVLEGSTTVTVAPGTGDSLFKTIGPMHPHQYRPNQLFVNEWLFEGLVQYEAGGIIAPLLAKTWVEEALPTGQRVTFTLQEGVTFHDGEQFNCTVAKMNLDHVLSPAVVQRHSWFALTDVLESWECNAEDQLVLETSRPFYPLLQELTYKRPLVFVSPAAFVNGIDTHPDLENSCTGDFGVGWEELEVGITVCSGLKGPWGTGPFQFESRTFLDGSNEEIDETATFTRFENYWGTVPEIEKIVVQHYDTQEEIFDALVAGDLDMALGSGPLSAAQLKELQLLHSTDIDVLRTDVLRNTLVVLNSGLAPTDDIQVRQAIIHAIDKAEFINQEFGSLDQPVTQLLPLSAPYCDVDLSPKWGYDLQKATLINCSNNGLGVPAIGGIAVAGLIILGLACFVGKLVAREKEGKPMFEPENVELKEMN